MDKLMLGIDIGNTYMKLVLCKGRMPQEYVTVMLPDNLVRGGRIVSYVAMADFLKSTLKEHKLRVREAALVIPMENYYIRRTRLPLMSDSQLRINIPYEMHNYITGAGEAGEYIYDYAVLDSDDQGMDLMIAAAPQSLIRNYQEMIARAGLKLVKAVPSALALQAVVMPPLNEKEKKELAAQRKEQERQKKKAQAAARKLEAKQQKEQNRKHKNTEIEKKDVQSGMIFQEYTEDGRIRIQDVLHQETSKTENEELYQEVMQENPTETDENTKSAQDKDFALMELGHEEVRLHFFSHRSFEITRTMNTGVRSIISIISEEKNVHPRIAQLMLENNQDGIIDENSGIQEILENIATEVMRVMNFYSYNNPGNSIDRIYYFGNAIHPARLGTYIHEATGLPMIAATELLPGFGDVQKPVNCVQAYGAVLE